MAACSQSGVTLCIVFVSRQIKCFHVAREVIQSSTIGDVIAIQIDASAGRRELVSWRADPTRAGLGSVFSVAVHTYNILRFMPSSKVVDVSAIFETGPRRDLERLTMVLMRFATGVLAYANGNELTPFPLNDLVIYGSRDRIDGRGLSRPTGSREMRVLTAAGETSEPYDNRNCRGSPSQRSAGHFSTARTSARRGRTASLPPH